MRFNSLQYERMMRDNDEISALKLYLRLGCKLLKVHRVLEFTHSNWLAPYIWHNTLKRQQSQSDFSKKYFKLMNNAFFGKSMEVGRVDIKIFRKALIFLENEDIIL